MGAFNSAVITKKGQALLSKTIQGGTKLTFTQIKTSEKALSGDLASLTNIGTVKQAEKVASVVIQNEYNIKVSASFSNKGLTAGYYIRNIGLYAKDPDEGEILYSISVADESTATADWMPPFNGVSVSSLMVDLITAVSSASSVNVMVDPTANATVAQITEVNERLTALSNAITTTAEETLSGSMAGGLKINKVCGNCKQVTTTGKNLLKNTTKGNQYSKTETINGITFTANDDGSITAKGTATDTAYYTIASKGFAVGNLQSGKYTLTGCPSGNSNCMLVVYSTDSGLGADMGKGVTFDVSDDKLALLQVDINIAKGATISNVTFYPMLRLASITDATYEPYTGGIPSPSPNYPQEIKSVEVSEIRACGKNLLAGVKLAEVATNYGSIIEQARFRVTKGKTYTISATLSAVSETTAYWNGLNGAFENETVNVKEGSFRYSKTFVALKDIDNILGEKNLILMSKSATGDKVYIEATDVQIESGSVATEYEPYKENIITLSQPITLNGIGDVADELTGDGVIRRVAVETVSLEENSINDNTKTFIGFPSRNMLGGTGLCSICHDYSDDISDTVHFYITDYSGASVVEVYADIDTSPTEATVAGVLLEEYTEEIPIVDQIALRSLLSYDGATCLSTDAEVDPVIEVDYGTSNAGIYTLTGFLTAQRNELKLSET